MVWMVLPLSYNKVIMVVSIISTLVIPPLQKCLMSELLFKSEYMNGYSCGMFS